MNTSHIAKSDQLFFDIFAKGYSGDEKSRGQCRVALQAFLNKPKVEVVKRIQGLHKMQAIASVSTDFAKLVSDAFNVTIGSVNFDLGYERSFKTVPLGMNQDTWDIYDVFNGLTFRQVPEGDRIQVDGLSGSLVTAHVDYYGGALGWTDKMIRYRKIAAMVDMAEIFRNRFWSNKADNHYLLLATAAALNVTVWQAGTGQLQRDISTINRAAFDLADRCKDKGYGDTAQAGLLLYANPIDKNRILAAFAATTAGLQIAGASGVTISWSITPIFTFNANIVAGSPILVMPGNKLQMAEDMPPTTFNAPKDVLTLNELQSVWSIYGAVVADTDQCQQLTLG
jgi:hypothetical protein